MSDTMRGWWRRRTADLKNVDPWPEEFLTRLNVELEAVRKQHRKVVRPARRRMSRKAIS